MIFKNDFKKLITNYTLQKITSSFAIVFIHIAQDMLKTY